MNETTGIHLGIVGGAQVANSVAIEEAEVGHVGTCLVCHPAACESDDSIALLKINT